MATDMKNKLAAVGRSIVHRNIWKTLSSMDRSRWTDMYKSDEFLKIRAENELADCV